MENGFETKLTFEKFDNDFLKVFERTISMGFVILLHFNLCNRISIEHFQNNVDHRETM